MASMATAFHAAWRDTLVRACQQDAACRRDEEVAGLWGRAITLVCQHLQQHHHH